MPTKKTIEVTQKIEVEIPDGYEFVRFDVPQVGEYFLSSYCTGMSTVRLAKNAGDLVGKYPIIRKKPQQRQITTNSEDQTVTMILPRKEAELVMLLVGNHTNKEVEEAVLRYAEWPYGLTLTVSDLNIKAGCNSLSFQLHDAIKDAIEQLYHTTTP